MAHHVATDLTIETVTQALDHLALAPDQTLQDIERACRDAAQHRIAEICLPPYAVEYAARLLRGTGVGLCGAVGMPLGHCGLRAKCDEAGTSIEAGAGAIDMALNLVALKSGRYGDVEQEVAAVRRLASGLVLKATLECCYLSDAEKVRAAHLAMDAGADVLKTHTGFGPGGARVHDVALLKRAAGTSAEVEAAGGVERFKQVHDFLGAGAGRVGVASVVRIIEDFYKWETA